MALNNVLVLYPVDTLQGKSDTISLSTKNGSYFLRKNKITCSNSLNFVFNETLDGFCIKYGLECMYLKLPN